MNGTNIPEHWFQRFSLGVLSLMFSAMLSLFLSLTYQQYETTINPIVEDFTIDSAAEGDGSLILSGTMRKVRDCEWLGVSAMARGESDTLEPARIVFLDPKTTTRPTGKQTWGPWSMVIAGGYEGKDVEIVARHQCHFAWQTTSHLITFAASRSDDGSIVVSQIQ